MVYELAYYTPNSINYVNTSTSTFFSQSKTDHYIFKTYATTDSSAPPLLYTLCFPCKGWNYKMTNIPGISDKSEQQLLVITS